MRRTAVSLAVLALLAGAGVGHATAATKPSCKIISDVAGDAEYNGAVPGHDSEDIVSGDLASDGKKLTAVVRLKSLANPDPEWVLGHVYSVAFSLKGMEADSIFMAARVYPQGTQYVLGHRSKDKVLPLTTSYTDASITGNVDTAKGEVRITAPVSAVAKLGKIAKGTVIKGAEAKAERILGQGVVPSQEVGGTRVPFGGLLLQMDLSDAGKAYTVGAKSCVTP